MLQPLEELVAKGWVWQGQQASPAQQPQNFIDSGWPPLNEALGGGWLQGSVNELQLDAPFIGELGLLAPLLRSQSSTIWLNPPAEPYAPGWQYQQLNAKQQLVLRSEQPEDTLWALQQCLQAGCAPLLLAWLPTVSPAAIRRYQLLAEQQQVLVFILTATQADTEARAYVNRLQLSREPGQPELQVTVLKRRYGWPLAPFTCAVDGQFPRRRAVRKVATVLTGPWQAQARL